MNRETYEQYSLGFLRLHYNVDRTPEECARELGTSATRVHFLAVVILGLPWVPLGIRTLADRFAVAIDIKKATRADWYPAA